MNRILESIMRCHNNIMKEQGIDKKSKPEMNLSRENGIDSLGIVNMILDIEEELDMDLENYLASIRKCKTVGELAFLIESIKGDVK